MPLELHTITHKYRQRGISVPDEVVILLKEKHEIQQLGCLS